MLLDVGHRAAARFCAKSELAEKAGLARLPYERVHVVRTSFLNDESARVLADAAYQDASVIDIGDINTDGVSDEFLRSVVGPGHDPIGCIAAAIQATGVYGSGAQALERCTQALEHKIDFLSSMGAAFHNDTDWQWPSCLFWVLALHVEDVEFVVPHLGFRTRMSRGDLIVFDPCLAHGVCRPRDGGQFMPEHFLGESGDQLQAFLSGELALRDQEWEALGCKWQPSSEPVFEGAASLLTAEFDQRTGALRMPPQSGRERGSST